MEILVRKQVAVHILGRVVCVAKVNEELDFCCRVGRGNLRERWRRRREESSRVRKELSEWEKEGNAERDRRVEKERLKGGGGRFHERKWPPMTDGRRRSGEAMATLLLPNLLLQRPLTYR